MKSIYSHRVMYQLQLLKIIPAARWLEQTATGNTVFLNGEHVLLTHKHTHTFDNFKDFKGFYTCMWKKCTKYVNVVVCSCFSTRKTLKYVNVHHSHQVTT